MKILVTGGNGFIGSNFIDYILQHTEWKIVNIDLLTYAGISPHPKNDRYIFYQADIGYDEVYTILEGHQPDFIINFAAETHVDRSIEFPDTFVETNVFGTYNLLRCLKRYAEQKQFRFVHVSTDEVYGSLDKDDLAFTEFTPYSPRSPYSATKAASDHLVQAFHHTYDVPAIIAHCSNNYGPKQHPEKLIPTIIHKAMRNEPIPIYGTGLNVRDWLYVEDHCRALYKILLDGVNGSTYNIGGQSERTNLEVTRLILSIMNRDESLITFVEDRKGHDFRYAIDINKIQTELGWRPFISFENGIYKTIEWYTSNTEWVTSCTDLESF